MQAVQKIDTPPRRVVIYPNEQPRKRALWTEARILTNYRHPHILTLLGTVAHPDGHALVNMAVLSTQRGVRRLRSEVNSELNFPSNFEGLVLGCIDADFCK